MLGLLPGAKLVGGIGQAVVERSNIDLQDAVFSLRASRCLNRMFYQLATGRYGEEVRTRDAALREHLRARDAESPGGR